MRANPLHTFLLTALIAVSATSSLLAQQNSSQQTSLTAAPCLKLGNLGAYSAFECRGLPGYSVVTGDDNHRTVYLSIGTNRHDAILQPAVRQIIPPFNAVQDDLEWRIAGGLPVATIQRWFIVDYTGKHNDPDLKNVGLLVVTRTPPGGSCHVAYVDVNENGDAYALARKAADELAQKFDCGKDKVHLIGNKGRAAELAAGR